MPRGFADLALSAQRTAAALPKAQLVGVSRAAQHVTTSIRGEILAVTGDNRLSGVGKRGARVGAEYKIFGSTNPTAYIKAKGPLHLVERDTRPHSIEPRGYRVSKRWQKLAAKGKVDTGSPVYLGGNKALLMPDGNLRRRSHSGGTSGQHPFERGWRSAAPETTLIFQRATRAEIAKAWS